MATRKVKRYDDGGEVDPLESANRSSESQEVAGEAILKGMRDAEAAKPSNFREAFAAARKAGDKTFEFGGKKFTTEMAGEKKAAPKPETTKVEASKTTSTKSSYETPYDRMNRMNRETEAAKRETDREVANLRSRHPAPGRGVINTRNINPNTLLPSKMAKGGMTASKRADGIAQRGKTRGKVY